MKHKLIKLTIVMFLLLQIKVIGQTFELIDYPFNKGSYHTGISDTRYLYCLSDFGIHIWNIENIEKPELISSQSLTGIYYDGKIDKYQNNLFILKGNKLYKSNVENVAHFEIKNLELTDSRIENFTIIDSFLVVSSYGFDGLNVYQIKNDTIELFSNFRIPAGYTFQKYKNRINFLTGSDIIMTELINGQIEILDTICFPQMISSFIANDSILCVSYHEIGDGFIPEYSYIIDIKDNNYPVLDSLTLSVSCRYDFITNNKLVTSDGSNRTLYCINKQTLNKVGDFNAFYCDNTCLVNDTIISAFNYSNGFSLYRFNCVSIGLIHEEKCSSWITSLHKSGENLIFESNDSLYFSNNQRYFNLNKEGKIKIIDSLLFEYTKNPFQIKYSIISGNQKKIIYTFPADNNGLVYFRKFGNYIYHYLNGIYDISNLNQPLVLSNNCQFVFDTYCDKFLVSHNTYNNTFKLYNPNNGNPTIEREYQLENLNFSRPWYTFRYTPLEKRAYGFATTDGYFYLDYADLDNVHYTQVRHESGMTNSAGLVKDSINWVLSNSFIYAEDISDIYHLRLIKKTQFDNFPQSMIFENDTTVLISFGGYVSRYKLTGFKAGDVQTWTRINEVIVEKSDLFPNPNNGNFSLKIQDDNIKTVRILNMNGQFVYMKRIETINNSINLDIDLRTGNYIVFIEGNKDNYFKKMTIK